MLLKLSEKINWADHPNIRPVCLPTRTNKLYTGATATVAGWGAYYKDWIAPGGLGPTNKVLQEVDMTVLSTEVQFFWSPVVVAILDTTKKLSPSRSVAKVMLMLDTIQQVIQDDMLCVQAEGLKAPCPCGIADDGIPIVVKDGLNYVQVRIVKRYTSVLDCCC